MLAQLYYFTHLSPPLPLSPLSLSPFSSRPRALHQVRREMRPPLTITSHLSRRASRFFFSFFLLRVTRYFNLFRRSLPRDSNSAPCESASRPARTVLLTLLLSAIRGSIAGPFESHPGRMESRSLLNRAVLIALNFRQAGFTWKQLSFCRV